MKRISVANVEAVLGRRRPWLQPGIQRGGDQHFALCPYCENPIQLKGLYKRSDAATTPYGSHAGDPVDGFAFDLHDLEFCPFRHGRDKPDRDARRKRGTISHELVETAVAQFDRIVLLLREDFGFDFSNRFARRMLEQWFDSEGFLYTGAHLRNLPWMVAYFGPSQNLFGQPVGCDPDLAASIARRAPQVVISHDGRLTAGASWYEVDLQCLDHRILISEDGTLTESMEMRLRDHTSSNEPEHANVVKRRRITFRPERFEALCSTPPERARRDHRLLAIAREVAGIKHRD